MLHFVTSSYYYHLSNEHVHCQALFSVIILLRVSGLFRGVASPQTQITREMEIVSNLTLLGDKFPYILENQKGFQTSFTL